MRSNQGGHNPLAPLRHRSFVVYTAQRLFGGTGMTLLQATMAWQVRLLSGSPGDAALHLALLGLFRFIPALGFSLLGGAVADAYNRRNIVRLSQLLPVACSLLLAVGTAGGWVTLELVYGLVFLVAMASSFENPAGQALLPSIVPTEEFSTAVTLSNSARQLGFVSGPALSGAIIGFAGVEYAYLAHMAMLACSIALVSMIVYRQSPGQNRGVSIASIVEGLGSSAAARCCWGL